MCTFLARIALTEMRQYNCVGERSQNSSSQEMINHPSFVCLFFFDPLVSLDIPVDIMQIYCTLDVPLDFLLNFNKPLLGSIFLIFTLRVPLCRKLTDK